MSENQGNEWKKICIYLLLLLISLRMSSTKSDKQTVSFIDTVSVVCCNGNKAGVEKFQRYGKTNNR
jgi:hypothetical protein